MPRVVTVQVDAAVARSAGMNGCVRLVQSRREREGCRGDSIACQDTARRRIRTPDGDLLRRILSVRRYSDAVSAGMAPGPRPRGPGDRHRAGGADADSHRCGSARHPADRSPWRDADCARRRGDARRGRLCRDGICRRLHRHPRRLCRDLGRIGAGDAARGFLRLAAGAGGFVLANMAGGVLLSRLGAGHLVWVLAATMAATAVAAWRLPRSPDGAAAAPRKSASGGLWRSGVFVAVIVGASLIQASHAVLYGFVTLQWTMKGLDGTTIGLLWAIGVVAEILLFAVSARVVASIGAVEMILLGRAGAVLRWTAMAFDP